MTLVATSPNVLVVDPKLGANTLADFVRIAKERKGQLNYGSVGNGSAAHLAMELFKSRAGLDLVHVPYQGFPQVVNAILAGQVQAGFMVPGIAIGQIRAGKLKALGVTTLGRAAVLPEIPSWSSRVIRTSRRSRGRPSSRRRRRRGHRRPRRARARPHHQERRRAREDARPVLQRRGHGAGGARDADEYRARRMGQGDQGGGVQPE